MSIFSRGSGLVVGLLALCLGGPAAHAQVAPLSYWIPGGPFGFGGSLSGVQSLNTYGDFPNFDFNGGGGGGFAARSSLPKGWFVGGESGAIGPGMGLGLNGFGGGGAFGNIGSYQSVQFGYNFQDETGASPFRVYGGLDTVKYNTGFGNPFIPSDNTSNTVTGYSAHGGVEFQATPNVSLSLGFGYTRQ
jgi:opacity protein-like surface antigen